MTRLLLFLLLISFNSCFLFRDLHKKTFHYTEEGKTRSVGIIVPSGYRRVETMKDSSGFETTFYHYRSGAILFFSRVRDTSHWSNGIDYASNIPRTLYQTVYFKGVNPNGRYWRESRLAGFRAGYHGVKEGREADFDSAVNYFSLHVPVNTNGTTVF